MFNYIIITHPEYNENTKETINVFDLAGNKTEANISIINIDATTLQAEIKYSTAKLTNQNVLVTITANKKIKDVTGWTLSNDGVTLTKEFEANKEETVIIYDLAGNGTIRNIEINNIEEKDTTVAIEKLPQTGANITIISVSTIAIILVSVIIYKKLNSYKSIK